MTPPLGEMADHGTRGHRDHPTELCSVSFVLVSHSLTVTVPTHNPLYALCAGFGIILT